MGTLESQLSSTLIFRTIFIVQLCDPGARRRRGQSFAARVQSGFVTSICISCKAEICATEYKWSSDETIQALKVAKAKNLIKEALYNEKISYRIIESTNDYTTHVESKSSKSESITDTTVLGVDGTTDFKDFKKFIHGEVLDLKSQLETRLPSAPSTTPRPVIDNERAFIKSLEHRIISLEKQLDDKQSIINKVLAEKASSNFNALWQRGNHSAVVKRTMGPIQSIQKT